MDDEKGVLEVSRIYQENLKKNVWYYSFVDSATITYLHMHGVGSGNSGPDAYCINNT